MPLLQIPTKHKDTTSIIGQHDSHSRSSLGLYNRLTFDVSIKIQYHIGITRQGNAQMNNLLGGSGTSALDASSLCCLQHKKKNLLSLFSTSP